MPDNAKYRLETPYGMFFIFKYGRFKRTVYNERGDVIKETSSEPWDDVTIQRAMRMCSYAFHLPYIKNYTKKCRLVKI